MQTGLGMVVDSDLGRVNAMNMRKEPVLGSYYLPPNIQLIYSSADVGKDSITNKALTFADSAATQCLRAIASGNVAFSDKKADTDWFENLRVLLPNR